MWWSCHLMRCDCLCCVMSRDAMRCHVMCTHVMCPAMVTLCVRSGSVTMWWSKVLFCTTKYYCVLQSPTPVLLCTTTYYSSTTLYYKVLLQYYSVLQSTTPVLLCTTTYYSSTTLYYKVLLQYYSVLQRTTPVLLCTTKYYSVLHSTTTYYSSTTLYYKVLLQYYPVLQSTTPVLLCTTKYYSSTTLYYTVLQRTTPVLLCTTKQHSWLFLDTYEPLFTWLMSVAYEASFTMCGATGVILQLHQILHLPRKMTVMIDPRHIWNVIYNARSNRSHNPTSPNTAPATQNESHDWSASHMKRHLQCAEQQESQSNFTKYCACHAKWISWLIRVTDETSFTMRGATGIIPQLHQILRLPRKMNLMIDPHHIWNVIYNARSKQSHPPTSRNTAPATQNESHDWSASHIYETSFTMRGATNSTPQLHQILRLPRKMNLMIDPRHIWNVIYNARRNKLHTTTSPNTARLPRNLQVPDFSGNSMNCFRQ